MCKIFKQVFHKRLLNGQKAHENIFIRGMCDSMFFKPRVFLARLTIIMLVMCSMKAQTLDPDPWV